jgi:hypothetical protein
MANSIFWKDHASATGHEMFIGSKYIASSVTISHSNVWGGQSYVFVAPGCSMTWGAGMIDGDPLFADEASGDLHILYSSPCRDTGDGTASGLPLVDFEGDPRVAFSEVDMGADEFSTHLYLMGDPTPNGAVTLNFVGAPGASPVWLWIAFDVMDAPLSTPYGPWHLAFPVIGPIDLAAIPGPDGLLSLPGTVPASPPGPYAVPLQALVGSKLTNLCLMEVN